MKTTVPITADELLALPDDGRQYELVRGELRVMEPAGGQHGSINMRFGSLLAQHVVAYRLGELFSEATGFKLASDPDTLRCPDLAFIGWGRIPPEGTGPGFIEGAPDLAIEVLSPDDTAIEMEEKIADYLAAGSLAVWVVNPRLRRVTVHQPDAPPRVLNETDSLDGGEILPGFNCPVGDIFDWPK